MHGGARGFYRDIIITLLCFLLFGCTGVPVREKSEIPHADAVSPVPIPVPNDQPTQSNSSVQASEVAKTLIVNIRKKRGQHSKLTDKHSENLWHRLGNGIELADIDHRLVDAKIKWYQQHQSHLDRVAERADPFLHLIVEQIDEQGMPLDLALLPIVESAYQPLAYSHRHAAGLWQFIPSTGTRFGLEQNKWYDGRRDILASTQAALDYLRSLHDQFDGDWLLALAAYNCGEARVAKAIERNRNAGRATDFWSLNLPSETRQYVPNLLALSSIVQKPEEYHLRLKSIPNKPVLTQVKAGKRFDLRQAAQIAGLSEKQLKAYNPGFKSWVTGPNGPHSILVPRPKASGLAKKLARLSPPPSGLPQNRQLGQIGHTVRRGETLAHVARRYGTSVRMLKRLNRLSGDMIPVGLPLRLPGPARSADATPTQGRKRFHIVQKGETLWHIAERYSTSIDQICAWNKLSPVRTLVPYRKLLILAKNAEPAEASLFFKTSGESAAHLVHQQFLRYRVKTGDSLWSIARRFGVPLAELCQWNRLSKRYRLQPGQDLMIYIEPASV
ncbi:MAG: LysM peptidoglycan-binding domain-containing protein [Gammaproteobacteria bacterium]